MNQDIKNKWVAALKSGEYIQGQGTLRRINNEYCCLGVLCDLYMKDGNAGRWDVLDNFSDRFVFTDILGEPSRTELTDHVSQWAGLDHWEGDRGLSQLMRMNDTPKEPEVDGGYSFEAIANYIDKKY